ncbi:MAG: hypothetical protein ACREC9_10085 [Methylocella sp.]
MTHASRCAVSIFLAGAILVALAAAVVKAETVIVEKVMPAPIVETAPPAPRPGMGWVPGHWVWRGGEWFWVKGHYAEGPVPTMPAVIVETPQPRPSPAHVWVRGHWGWEGNRWNWHPGIWFRP